MTQYAIANETVFPTANDVAATSGDGKLGRELKLTPWRLADQQNHVLSGFKAPVSSANLDISIPSGTAMVGGYHVTVPGSTTVTTVNGTNYLYLALTRDGSGKVNGAVFDRLSSAFEVADYCLIAMLIASGGVITDTIDARRVAPYSGPFAVPVTTPAPSTYSNEGFQLMSANGSYGGVRAYNAFRLKAGVTMTVNRPILCLMADRVIEIAGTINGSGAGGGAGAAGTVGNPGTDQAGGGGGGTGVDPGSRGGAAVINGNTVQAGGIAGTGAGSNATALTGYEIMYAVDVLRSLSGGAGGGGGGGGGSAGNGGIGGASIVIIAPVIILKSTAVFNSSGTNGANASSGNAGGGGGGGAGNVWFVCKQGWFIDEGHSVVQTGGSGGSASGAGGNGGNGAAGIRQVLTWI